MKFYTTGCRGKQLESLTELLDRHEALLADIRFAPHSRDIRWTKNYLSLMLKNRYRHVIALGNRNFDKPDAPIQIHNLELGIRLIESWGSNVVLVCACEELENCHRNVVKTELERRGHDVIELADWNLS